MKDDAYMKRLDTLIQDEMDKRELTIFDWSNSYLKGLIIARELYIKIKNGGISLWIILFTGFQQ